MLCILTNFIVNNTTLFYTHYIETIRPKKAQSLLELTAVITLVTLGLFFAGPTLLRNINAHFKLWDDSIQDSYNDPLEKAPPLQGIPIICTCTPFQGAPSQNCGSSPCSPQERLETKTCNPVGCEQARGFPVERCISDTTCCGTIVDTTCGFGRNNLPTNNVNYLPACTGTTTTACDCSTGQRITQRGCGGNTTNFGCRIDDQPLNIDGNPSCMPTCLGPFALDEPSAAGTDLPVICPGDNAPPLSICGDLPLATCDSDSTGSVGRDVTLLGSGANACNHPVPTPNPNEKCEAYCIPPLVPNGALCRPPACANEERFIIHICDDDFYDPIKNRINPTPGGLCQKPSDNGGLVCDTAGAILASGDTSTRCPNLDSARVPVKAGDLVEFHKTNSGGTARGSVTYTPTAPSLPICQYPACPDPCENPPPTNAPCEDACLSGSITINTNRATINVPCDGSITNFGANDNIATTLTRPARGTRTFVFQQPEVNNTIRILGRWGDCHVTACEGTTSGNSNKKCTVLKTSLPLTPTNVIHPPNVRTCRTWPAPAVVGPPPPPYNRWCCWRTDDQHCLKDGNYLSTRAINPGEWYLNLVTGANDRISKAEVKCSCPECGNGDVFGTEQCDDTNLNGQNCASFGLMDGTLTCNADCTVNTTACL